MLHILEIMEHIIKQFIKGVFILVFCFNLITSLSATLFLAPQSQLIKEKESIYTRKVPEWEMPNNQIDRIRAYMIWRDLVNKVRRGEPKDLLKIENFINSIKTICYNSLIPSILIIDGDQGIGKTTLAKMLSYLMPKMIKIISTDFIKTNDQFFSLIDGFLKENKYKLLIIEGIASKLQYLSLFHAKKTKLAEHHLIEVHIPYGYRGDVVATHVQLNLPKALASQHFKDYIAKQSKILSISS